MSPQHRLAVIGALVVVACSGGDAVGSTPALRSSSWEVTVSPGSPARLGTSDLSLDLVQVRSDSRCPASVQCVWQGTVVADFQLLHHGGAEGKPVSPLRLSLETPSEAEGMRFTLVKVSPDSREGVVVPPNQYILTVRVERVDSGAASAVSR